MRDLATNALQSRCSRNVVVKNISGFYFLRRVMTQYPETLLYSSPGDRRRFAFPLLRCASQIAETFQHGKHEGL